MTDEGEKGITGREGQMLRVDPLHFDMSKADLRPTHPMLLNQAVEALVRIYRARADQNPRLQVENAFPAIIMAAAMFEAVANLTLQEGFKEPAVFRELEKATPLAKWIALRGLSDPPDFSTEPAAGVKSLFRVRNAIVHAKPDEGKRLITEKGLKVQGVLRASSVDRMLASAVEGSCDAITRAPWNYRMSAIEVWAWSVHLDNHGPLRWHLMRLPERSITRSSLLVLAPNSGTERA